jgi:hypothetical protein
MKPRVELRIADVFTPTLYLVSDLGEAWVSSVQAGRGQAATARSLEGLRKQAETLASVLGVDVTVR